MSTQKRHPGDVVRLPSGHLSALVHRFRGQWVAAMVRQASAVTGDEIDVMATSKGREVRLALALDTQGALPDWLVGSSRLWGRLADGETAVAWLSWRAWLGCRLPKGQAGVVRARMRHGDAPGAYEAMEAAMAYRREVSTRQPLGAGEAANGD